MGTVPRRNRERELWFPKPEVFLSVRNNPKNWVTRGIKCALIGYSSGVTKEDCVVMARVQ